MPDYLPTETVAARFRTMRYSGNHQRFLVNRMGNTGSTWLAKLLNAHPEVFCEHEGVVSRIWPRSAYDEEDILQYVEFIAAYERHEAYFAVGDIGSTWLNHVIEAPADEFSTAILLRHPIRILNTRLRQVRSGYVEFTDFATAEIQRYFAIDPNTLGEADRYFVNDCAVFLSVAEHFGDVGSVIRIEGFCDQAYATSVLKELTGLTYPPDLIQKLWFQRINSHNNASDPARIFAGFSSWQQDFYMTHIDPVARATGYELANDEPAVTFEIERELPTGSARTVNSGKVVAIEDNVRVITSGTRGDYAAYVDIKGTDAGPASITLRVDVRVLEGILGIVVQGEKWGDQLAGQTVRANDQRQSVDLIINPASRARRLVLRNDTKDGTQTVADIERIALGRLNLAGWPEYQPR